MPTLVRSTMTLVLAGAACGRSGDKGASAGASVGVASVTEASAALKAALALGASTWPGATVNGVKLGDEALEVGRTGDRVQLRNAYTVRVRFGFDADPTDPTARSGSVVCTPACRVVRHKVAHPAVAPWPCSFDDALAAARAAGVTAAQPVVGYGGWAVDFATGRRWSGWIFRADADAPVVEIGAGCQVVP